MCRLLFTVDSVLVLHLSHVDCHMGTHRDLSKQSCKDLQHNAFTRISAHTMKGYMLYHRVRGDKVASSLRARIAYRTPPQHEASVLQVFVCHSRNLFTVRVSTKGSDTKNHSWVSCSPTCRPGHSGTVHHLPSNRDCCHWHHHRRSDAAA